MPLYLVSYTLRPERQAPEIEEELKRPPAGWMHHIDFTWIIATHESARQLYDRVRTKFQDTDSLLIFEIPPNASYYGWLPKPAWDWISKHRNY